MMVIHDENKVIHDERDASHDWKGEIFDVNDRNQIKISWKAWLSSFNFNLLFLFLYPMIIWAISYICHYYKKNQIVFNFDFCIRHMQCNAHGTYS